MSAAIQIIRDCNSGAYPHDLWINGKRAALLDDGQADTMERLKATARKVASHEAEIASLRGQRQADIASMQRLTAELAAFRAGASS